MKYEVTLKVVIEAESARDAYEIGVNAAVHLSDTFNDDMTLWQIDVEPCPKVQE